MDKIEPGTEFTWKGERYEVLSIMYDQEVFPDWWWVRTSGGDRELCTGHIIRKASNT